MKKYDFVIIGSGLGGLLTAYILVKEGLNVCALEKNTQFGGASQNFVRDKVVFDTGIHYIGSFDKGQVLYNYFKYFNLSGKMNMLKLNTNAFDIISFDGDDNEYQYANGYDAFKKRLTEIFPQESLNIDKYIADLKKIKSSYPLYNLEIPNNFFVNESKYNSCPASAYLKSLTNNKKLQNVLAGTNLLYAGKRGSSPLSVHALINNSYIESAYKFIDGSAQMIDLLVKQIREAGGVILNKKEIVKFNFEGKNISSVETSTGERFFAKKFISNFHPKETFKLIPEDKVRRIYYNRIVNLKNTISTFAFYITLKNNTLEYKNSNYYHYRQNDVWCAGSYTPETWPNTYMLVSNYDAKNPKYANGLSILTYMNMQEVEKWKNTKIGRRGDTYAAFKQQKVEQMLDVLNQRFPGIKNKINKVYTSSPLTYRDYIGCSDGSIYGIEKDAKNWNKNIVMPKTKIPNLLFTGQNINLHGVLGVTIGSVLTAASVLGLEYLVKKIKSKI